MALFVPDDRTKPEADLPSSIVASLGFTQSPPPGGVEDPGRSAAVSVAVAQLRERAEQAIPGCDGTEVAVSAPGRRPARSSSGVASAMHEIQYETGDGPVLEAMATGRAVRSGAIGVGETRWPAFTAASGPTGVRSVLSVTMATDGRTIGSVTWYASRRDGFDELTVATAESFARLAGPSVDPLAPRAGDGPAGPGSTASHAHSTELPVGLIHGIEALVGAPGPVCCRAAAILRITEEIYRTVEWARRRDVRAEELDSLAQFESAARDHQTRMAALAGDDSAAGEAE